MSKSQFVASGLLLLVVVSTLQCAKPEPAAEAAAVAGDLNNHRARSADRTRAG